MWNVETGQLEKQFKRNGQTCACRCAFIGNNREYMVGGDEKDVVVWNRQSGQQVSRLSGHTSSVFGIAVHPTDPCKFISYSDGKSFIMYLLCVVL